MRIRLLTITHKVPSWIKEGFADYSKRLPALYPLELIEIPAEKRMAGQHSQKLISKEGDKLLAAVKPNHRIIALDVRGEAWSTEQLADLIRDWRQSGKNIDLLVGGADGLSQPCLNKVERTWSLSPLTFPHALVRIIIAEQIYRAYTILQNHPYHRR